MPTRRPCPEHAGPDARDLAAAARRHARAERIWARLPAAGVTEADSAAVPVAVIVRPAATVAAAPAPAACSQAGHQQEDHGGPLGAAEPAQHQRGEIASHLFHRRPGGDLLAS